MTEETWIDRFNSFCNKLLVTKDTKYLTERQIQFVKDEFKNKNIEYIVEEFCSYWEVAKKPKTFVSTKCLTSTLIFGHEDIPFSGNSIYPLL